MKPETLYVLSQLTGDGIECYLPLVKVSGCDFLYKEGTKYKQALVRRATKGTTYTISLASNSKKGRTAYVNIDTVFGVYLPKRLIWRIPFDNLPETASLALSKRYDVCLWKSQKESVPHTLPRPLLKSHKKASLTYDEILPKGLAKQETPKATDLDSIKDLLKGDEAVDI